MKSYRKKFSIKHYLCSDDAARRAMDMINRTPRRECVPCADPGFDACGNVGDARCSQCDEHNLRRIRLEINGTSGLNDKRQALRQHTDESLYHMLDDSASSSEPGEQVREVRQAEKERKKKKAAEVTKNKQPQHGEEENANKEQYVSESFDTKATWSWQQSSVSPDSETKSAEQWQDHEASPWVPIHAWHESWSWTKDSSGRIMTLGSWKDVQSPSQADPPIETCKLFMNSGRFRKPPKVPQALSSITEAFHWQ